MKITALQVDGYGIWKELALDDLSDGLNVFYGPNEAGKTTLMQFVRSVLYGFSAERRRYLPPVRGGRPGGSLDVAGPNGRFQITRCPNLDGPNASDQVTLSAPDGTHQGEHLLRVLLCGVDEAIFNNVFAVGLEELQELGTLSDTEAASLLYSLSAGLDRVALIDVVRQLEESRNRLLRTDGGPSQVIQLLDEREKLRAEIEQLAELTRRYGRLAGQRQQLNRETARLEEEINQLEYQARVLEIAAAVRDRWSRRRQLDDQLHALGPADPMPEGAVEELDAINAALQRRGQRVGHLETQWQQVRSEASHVKINEALWRLAPRVEALEEQESWVETLHKRSGELETEITDLEAQLSAEQQRLGLGGAPGTDAPPSIPARSLRALREPAKALRQSRQHLENAEQEIATAHATAHSLVGEIEAALTARGEQSLGEAMDRTGGLVAQLRRRVQIDERLEQMDSFQIELERQSRQLLDRQVLPAWVLMGLGAMFVVSVVLVMAGLFMPASITGALGWPLSVVGLGGLAAAVATKFLLERSNARRLEACQQQINMLQLQIKQAKQEREILDGQFPQGSGPLAGRLKTAEGELAELEQLVPLDARRKAAVQEAEAAAGRARQARLELDAARRQWQEALGMLGLPQNLSPKQVRRLASRCDQIGQLRRQLENRYEEYEHRRHELEALTARITQLASDAGLTLEGDDLIAHIRTLVRQLSEQEARFKRRQALRKQTRQLRRKRARHLAAIDRLKHRRRRRLRQVGADDVQEFRRKAAQIQSIQALRRERDALGREIEAAIAGHCPEQAVGEQLEAERHGGIEQRREHLQERLRTAEAELQERFEKRGQLSEQMKILAEDRTPAAKQLELAMVEERLEKAVHRWRVLAVTSRILNMIRTVYEQQRQPETLQEASGYLERLTQGRYVRVWTPLDEDVLRIDDAEGKSLAVEVLSRGVREQLFLCLRLALANSFARRGALLPIVLDDVLVNFDSPRAKAAVALLRDFAAAGHQLLVFTCHEHIVGWFSSLHVQVRQLPGSPDLDILLRASRKSSGKRRKRKAEPKELPLEPAASADGRRQAKRVPKRATGDMHEQPPEDLDYEEEDDEPAEEIISWDEAETDEPEELLGEGDEEEVFDEDDEDEQRRDANVDYYVDQASYDERGAEIRGQDEADEQFDDEYDEEEGPFDDDYEEDEHGYEEEDDYDDLDEAA